MRPNLSIVILNYNTKKFLDGLFTSLGEVRGEADFEVIVVDNGSEDKSSELIKLIKGIKLIQNKKNLGFAKGNNSARKVVRGEFVLFLNTDTKVPRGTIKKSLEKMASDKKIGILTCRMKMKNGKLDRDARRSFPTPWVSLTHFTALDRIFPRSKLFSRYWYGWIPPETTHEIDASQGAFLLTRKTILDKVGWFSEDYFLDGEDIDLSWKIKSLGYRVLYYPEAWIWHFKKGTKKGEYKNVKFVISGVDAMRIFYVKRLAGDYSLAVGFLVLLGITLVKMARIVKYYTA